MQPAATILEGLPGTDTSKAQNSHGLQDGELASALRRHQAQGRARWHVIANAFAVRILAADQVGTSWVDVGVGDLGDDSFVLIKAAAKSKRLTWEEVQDADLTQVSTNAINPQKASLAKLNAWLSRREEATRGRKGEISKATMDEVASLAAWRCQFEGCGENLRAHLRPGSRGNFAYFAHIIASSPDGPRGDRLRSPLLYNNPSNILLLCDKCHRLIDRVASNQYPEQRLLDMRQRNLASVERCLESLRYPLARVLVLAGNVQGQSAGFDERVAEEAMWLQHLRRDNNRPEFFANHGGHLGDPHSKAYWPSFFGLLKAEIPRIQAVLNGTAHDSPQGMPIALFPAPHSTSVLVLTGRLLGEARSIHLFQFHRDQMAGTYGGQWAWRGDPPSADKYHVNVLHKHQAGLNEATLLVYLTDTIPATELPANLYANGGWKHPTILVTVDQPSRLVIAHPEDLQLFGLALESALRIVQDEWRTSTVNLIVIAPITACVRLGQKMQARCQPDFLLYERAATAGRGAFLPTVRITSQYVTHVETATSCPLNPENL